MPGTVQDDQATKAPLHWRFAVLTLAGLIVAGALYVIATRGEVMLVDLATQYASAVWCF